MMRACDCCLRKRARYYCLADDAFLCQKCDGLVHSANPFACRHDRVRLKNISFKSITQPTLPSWHRGSAKKPRTPRKSGLHRSKSEESTNPNQNQLYAVPQLEVEENTTSSHDDEGDDSKLIQLVPTLDPFGSELCSSTSTSSGPTMEVEGSSVVMSHMMMGRGKPEDEYPPSDLYLDQFAADVETLLGKGLDGEEPYGIKELGLLECCYDTPSGNDCNTPVDFLREVKAEDNDQSGTMSNKEGDMIEVCNDDVENGEPFDFSFDNCDDDREGDEQKGGYFKALIENFNEGDDNSNDILSKMEEEEEKEKEVEIKGKKIILRLDYEAISEAWANQGSPWIDGQRPQINHDHYWPHFMGACGVQIVHNPLHLDQEMGGVGVNNDSEREARVLRYREKRRTRLFAKKIRYEVRKLNAEKRPRMKGRFVKRSSFASSPTPSNSICI